MSGSNFKRQKSASKSVEQGMTHKLNTYLYEIKRGDFVVHYASPRKVQIPRP